MVGYVHSNYKLEKLEAELNSDKAKILNTTAHSLVKPDYIYESKHSRHFEWQDNRGMACPIKVYHLWETRP